MEEQIAKKNTDFSGVVDTVEVVGDIAEAALESEEVIEGCGEVLGDVLENVDELPILAIIGIIAGIGAAIGGIIFAVKKIKKR